MTLAGSVAHAQKGGGASGRYEAFMSAMYLGISKGSTQLDLAPGFQFIPMPSWSWMQVGGDITYQKIAVSGGSASNIIFMGGITGNIGIALSDSFFVSLGLALRSGSSDIVSAGENPNGFGFFFLTGKRFPIGGSWSFRPSMGVVATGTTGIVVRPFAVSYAF